MTGRTRSPPTTGFAGPGLIHAVVEHDRAGVLRRPRCAARRNGARTRARGCSASAARARSMFAGLPRRSSLLHQGRRAGPDRLRPRPAGMDVGRRRDREIPEGELTRVVVDDTPVAAAARERAVLRAPRPLLAPRLLAQPTAPSTATRSCASATARASTAATARCSKARRRRRNPPLRLASRTSAVGDCAASRDPARDSVDVGPWCRGHPRGPRAGCPAQSRHARGARRAAGGALRRRLGGGRDAAGRRGGRGHALHRLRARGDRRRPPLRRRARPAGQRRDRCRHGQQRARPRPAHAACPLARPTPSPTRPPSRT